jgi:hypothetical protein
MAQSDPRFRSFHALRIKGFAKCDIVAEIAGHPVDEAQSHLHDLMAKEYAQFMEARAMWKLTAAGKEAHKAELAADAPPEVQAAIHVHYPTFVEINGEFKTLCGDWQLIEGNADRPNDHSDPSYDAKVIARLVELDREARPVVERMGHEHERLAPYAPRLGTALANLQAGNPKMFTGVMCNSFHDVWMELHEDLILTLGINRAAEGSF